MTSAAAPSLTAQAARDSAGVADGTRTRYCVHQEATNAAAAEEITQDLAHGPRALQQSLVKGLCVGSSPCSLSLHRRASLRPLTVKLSGRAQALDWSRGRILSSSARGDTTDFHGPLQ